MNGTLTTTLAIILVLMSSALAREQSASPAIPVPGQAAKGQQGPLSHRFVKDELIVRFKKRTSEATIAVAHAQAGAKEMHRFANVEGLTRVKLAPGTPLRGALAQYRKSTGVMYVLPNY